MLYVEKDLAQCVKVAFDKWDSNKAKLNHQYLYVANMRLSPNEFRTAIEKGSSHPQPRNWDPWRLLTYIVTGRKCTYTVLPTTGVPDRDVMFTLYNDIGMYGVKPIPDPNLLGLGVKFHTLEDFIKDSLVPHLKI